MNPKTERVIALVQTVTSLTKQLDEAMAAVEAEVNGTSKPIGVATAVEAGVVTVAESYDEPVPVEVPLVSKPKKRRKPRPAGVQDGEEIREAVVRVIREQGGSAKLEDIARHLFVGAVTRHRKRQTSYALTSARKHFGGDVLWYDYQENIWKCVPERGGQAQAQGRRKPGQDKTFGPVTRLPGVREDEYNYEFVARFLREHKITPCTTLELVGLLYEEADSTETRAVRGACRKAGDKGLIVFDSKRECWILPEEA